MQARPFKFDNIYLINGRLATSNLAPGYSVYGEKLIRINNMEYREWIPSRSKPAAAIKKGLKVFPIKKGSRILYLGAASGTTVSHFSDIVGEEGLIYAIEISDRTLRELLPIAKTRKNIVPLLADARMPEKYNFVEELDIVYADVAVREQSEILVRNAKMFLKPKGFGMIAIKSRSIDVTEKPKIIYKQQRKVLEKFFTVTDFTTLNPYEKDHGFFVLKRRG